MLRHQEPTAQGQVSARTTTAADVVVGCDGSAGSARALFQAAGEAVRRQARLVIVTVPANTPPVPGSRLAWDRSERDAVDHAHAVNADARRRVTTARPDLVVKAIVAGSAQELRPVAADAGLLVLGRRGANGVGLFRMASVSDELVRRFTCPVLVCRDDSYVFSSKPGRTWSLRMPEVIAAVHLPEEVPTVLRHAISEAAVRALPLCVLNSGPTSVDDAVQTMLARETSLLWQMVRTADDATASLLNYAEPQDLLVLGNRRGGRLAGHNAGSVIRAVLDQSPCDVLIVQVPESGDPT